MSDETPRKESADDDYGWKDPKTILLAVVVAAVALGPMCLHVDMSTIPFMVAIAAAYLAPSIVAYNSQKRNLTAIVITNVLLGWTIVGWIAALIWATMKDS